MFGSCELSQTHLHRANSPLTTVNQNTENNVARELFNHHRVLEIKALSKKRYTK